jgi:hypothetical protein
MHARREGVASEIVQAEGDVPSRMRPINKAEDIPRSSQGGNLGNRKHKAGAGHDVRNRDQPCAIRYNFSERLHDVSVAASSERQIGEFQNDAFSRHTLAQDGQVRIVAKLRGYDFIARL